MTTYYDVILALIPVTLLGITGVLVAAGVALTTAVPAGATIATGLIAHAMFVNGPGGSGEPTGEPAKMDFESAGGD